MMGFPLPVLHWHERCIAALARLPRRRAAFRGALSCSPTHCRLAVPTGGRRIGKQAALTASQPRDQPAAAETGDSPAAAKTASGGGIVRGAIAFVAQLGPGLITGAADDDPTAIATYAQAGASFRYGLLWTCLLTYPMMATVQYIAAKVALVHGKGLAGVIGERYPRGLLYAAVLGLTFANVVNAGADLGAIAAAINLIVPIPRALLIVPVAVFLLAFLAFGSYHLIEDTFKWLTLALLAYVISAFLAHPDYGAMLKGTFVPHISLGAAFLTLLVATLGGNVSPYLFFWEADLEVSEEASQRPVRAHRLRLAANLKDLAWDTNVGMIFSNIIIFFIEVASAATLPKLGMTNVTSAAAAARALRPVLGSGATYLWAVGMIGSGLLAVPALTGSVADAVSSTFGWPHGIEDRPSRAVRFYLVLAVALGIGAAIDYVGINPMRALVLAGALNGLLTPPLLVLLLLIANRRDVMGDHTNGLGLNILGWATTAIMAAAAIVLLWTVL